MLGIRRIQRAIIVAALSIAGSVFGHDEGIVSETGTSSLQAVGSSGDSANPEPVVVGVANLDGKLSFGLGDQVVVKVKNLKTLLRHPPDEGAWPLLYINGLPIRGGELFSFDSTGNEAGTLQYSLGYDSLLAKSWKLLYRFTQPRQNVRVSVGYDNLGACKIAAGVPTVTLIVYHVWYAVITFVVLIVAIVVFFRKVPKTTLIRDGDINSSYSLGKTQLAWWSIIIIGTYVFIGIATGAFPGLSTNILILLGISMGTTAGAQMLSSGALKKNEIKLSTKGFLADILTDGTGISMHRLQMLMWTVLFGGYFILRSFSKLELPTIDDGQLMLMGISSATYLGLRVAEKNSDVNSGADGKPTKTDDASGNGTPMVTQDSDTNPTK